MSIGTRIEQFFLRKDLWIFDLLVCIAFGSYLSNVLQTEASSESTGGIEIQVATVLSGLSYALACPLALLPKGRLKFLPSWLLLGGIGSWINAFLHWTFFFAYISWSDRFEGKLLTYVWSLVPHIFENILILGILFTIGSSMTLIFSRAVLFPLIGFHKQKITEVV